jgi:hypothetical protein
VCKKLGAESKEVLRERQGKRKLQRSEKQHLDGGNTVGRVRRKAGERGGGKQGTVYW